MQGKKKKACQPRRYHLSSSSSSSASSKPYRPCGSGGFQSPLGRGRKLSLCTRFALMATVCGFLDDDVDPERTLRAWYEPVVAALSAVGSLDGGRPIPSAACCCRVCCTAVADTARVTCRTGTPPLTATALAVARTGTGIAILLGGWLWPALAPLAERGTNPGTWGATLVSASRRRLLGTDCEHPAPRLMLDAGRTAGVIEPFPGAELGVVDRGGTDPARPFAPPSRFSLSLAPAALSRVCSMLSPCTRKGRPASASHAGMDVRRSFSS